MTTTKEIAEILHYDVADHLMDASMVLDRLYKESKSRKDRKEISFRRKIEQLRVMIGCVYESIYDVIIDMGEDENDIL
jgi:hypothetical protein